MSRSRTAAVFGAALFVTACGPITLKPKGGGTLTATPPSVSVPLNPLPAPPPPPAGVDSLGGGGGVDSLGGGGAGVGG